MSKINVLITSGGTSEAIDPVRKITNVSTGRLGAKIANEFVRQKGGELGTVYYVCADNAQRPDPAKQIKVFPTKGVLGMLSAIEDVMKKEKIDIVVHPAAISDFFCQPCCLKGRNGKVSDGGGIKGY